MNNLQNKKKLEKSPQQFLRCKACEGKRGQALIMSVLFFMIISGVILQGVVLPASAQIKSSRDFFRSKQSMVAADALTDEALYRLNQSLDLPGSYSLPYAGGVTAQAVVTDISGGKQITTTGDSGQATRVSRGIFSQDVGTSFNYGLQIGNGGISMSGSSRINGSVYSNGTIQGCSSCVITGSASAANISALSSHVSNTAPSETHSIVFANSSTNQDLAQGFRVSTTEPITRVRFYLKKVGTPSNATIRITTDNAGQPSGTTVGQGTLSSSLVANVFGYIEVILNSPVNLTPGTQYWLVIDASNNTTKYYVSGALDNTYSDGVAKIGRQGGTWNSTSPASLDLFFEVFVGGLYGKILGTSQYNRLTVGSNGQGTAHANLVNSVSLADKLYCQSSEYVYKQSSGTLMSCDTSRADPPQLAFPVSDSNIAEWKNSVENSVNEISGGWTYNGNLNINYNGTTTTSLRTVNGNLTLDCSSYPANFGDLIVTGNVVAQSSCIYNFDTLKIGGNFTVMGSANGKAGPIKVGGNVLVQDSGRLYLKGPAYIVGNTSVSGSASLKLDSSYGLSDGYVVSDGTISISGSGASDGSGQSTSYIIFVTTSQCPYSGSCALSSAISLNGSAGAIVLVAPYGDVAVSGSARAKSVVGYKITMTGSAIIDYETGLTNIDFVGGPSGSWTVDSWREVAE